MACVLCASACRGHSLGRPEEWEPEPGSAAALAVDAVLIASKDGSPLLLTTDGEKRIWNSALELAAEIVAEATSWGLSPTKAAAVERFQRFGAHAIRAQRTDSPERIAGKAAVLIEREG